MTSDLPEGGTVRPITRWGEAVMHRELCEVETFDEELHHLVADMVATMRAAEGVGLAANQIGVDQKVFVFDCPDEDGVRHRGVVCNPVLELPEGRDRRLEDADEGCLSLPGAFVGCARPDFALVRGLDQFGDRLARRARKKLLGEAERNAGYFPSGWPADGG